MDKIFIRANEIAEALNVSEGMAYKLIRQMNAELEEQGYITVRGRVSRKYFQEKFYGADMK